LAPGLGYVRDELQPRPFIIAKLITPDDTGPFYTQLNS